MFDVLFETVAEGDERYIEWLLTGLGWTFSLALSGWAIAFVIGVVVGCGRTSSSTLIGVASRLFVEIFRNVPIIVQMFLWYFVVPEILPKDIGAWVKSIPPPWGSFLPALIALSLYTAARVAEQVKAGIEALPPGQRAAAKALGMTGFGVYRFVLMPQAMRIITPTLTSEVMGIYKNTSVALTIGLLELTAQARQINEFTFKTFEAFGAATLIYLGLALAVFVLMQAMENHFRIPGQDDAHNRTRQLAPGSAPRAGPKP